MTITDTLERLRREAGASPDDLALIMALADEVFGDTEQRDAFTGHTVTIIDLMQTPEDRARAISMMEAILTAKIIGPEGIRSKATEIVARLTGKPDWWDLTADQLTAEHFQSDEYRSWEQQWDAAAHELATLVPDFDLLTWAMCPVETPAQWRTDVDHLIIHARILVERHATPDADRARCLARAAAGGMPSAPEAYKPIHAQMALTVLEWEYARLAPEAVLRRVTLDEARSYLVDFEARCCALG